MAITTNGNTSSVTTETLPVTPYGLYLRVVGSTTNALRFRTNGFDYYPFQLGGIEGQRSALVNRTVIDVVDFKMDSQ